MLLLPSTSTGGVNVAFGVVNVAFGVVDCSVEVLVVGGVVVVVVVLLLLAVVFVGFLRPLIFGVPVVVPSSSASPGVACRF